MNVKLNKNKKEKTNMKTLPKEIVEYLNALGYEAKPVMELFKAVATAKNVKTANCRGRVKMVKRTPRSTTARACRCLNDGNCFKSQAAASRYYFKTVTYAQNISSICRGKSLKNIHGLKFEYI